MFLTMADWKASNIQKKKKQKAMTMDFRLSSQMEICNFICIWLDFQVFLDMDYKPKALSHNTFYV